MSGLAALLAGHNPPGAYQWHSGSKVDDVRHAVEHAGWRFAHLDGWTVEEREPFAKALGAALDLDDSGDLEAVARGLGSVGAGGAAAGAQQKVAGEAQARQLLAQVG